MTTKPSPQRPLGYPALHRVQRGCSYVAQAKPDDAYMMCIAQLHNLSNTTTAALLQVFKNATLAACWMLRDIEQRDPQQRFAAFRKTNSTHYFTDGIADAIAKQYRTTILSRYALNSYLYNGVAVTLASMIAGYLHKVADAHKRGLFAQFQQSAAFVVGVGRNRGKTLGSLGRRTIFGYAFLTPTRAQCEEALKHITILREQDDEAHSIDTAKAYCMPFGPRRNKPLGTARSETLHRLKVVVERYFAEMDAYDTLRVQAQQYLRFTPPRFPRLKSDGLSVARRQQLQATHMHALEAFGALPALDDDLLERDLTADERALFRQLQQQVYADTQAPKYVPLRWTRADAPMRHRECGVVYDPKKKRYLFLAYILAHRSRHRRPLTVNHQLFDVNNPTVPLTTSRRATSARLFELEFGTHQQQILDQARRHSFRWKDATNRSGGSVRSATLHACYAQDRKQWWFEVHLAIGIKPTHIESPQCVAGVHIDPMNGWFITILGLDGTHHAHVHLDEYTIAAWLGNKDPAHQAQLHHNQRTAKERQHRIADALVAICKHYQAQVGIENISYRKRLIGPRAAHIRADYSRSVVTLLDYKLACAHLPLAIDVRAVSPKRDCGCCGCRHAHAHVTNDMFTCSACDHRESRYANTSREVARRIVWSLAQRTRPKQKK